MERYQTISRRIAASFIDTLFFAPILAVSLLYQKDAVGTSTGLAWSVATFAGPCAFRIYFHSRYGATPGKALMKCRVVTAAGEGKIGLAAALIRELPDALIGLFLIAQTYWLSHPASVLTIAGIVAAVWAIADMAVALFHPKHRALHDLIARTVVVRSTPEASAGATLATSPADLRIPSLLANPHYVDASPGVRVVAAFINWMLVGGMMSFSLLVVRATAGLSAEIISKLLMVVLATLFWLACGIARSSPGAAFCQLRFCDVNGAALRLRIALLRSLPFYVIALLVLLPFRSLGSTGGPAILLFITAYLGALVMNFSIVGTTGRTHLDLWLGVRVLKLRLSPSIMPKILGIPIK